MGAPLFWQICVGLINEFIGDQDEVAREVIVLTIIRQRDLFLRVKNSIGAPLMDLVVGKQVLASMQRGEMASASKQRA